MNIKDLKQHAADYADEVAPYLKGEIQAFVQWIENKKPEGGPVFIPPVPIEPEPVDTVKAGKEAAKASQDK